MALRYGSENPESEAFVRRRGGTSSSSTASGSRKPFVIAAVGVTVLVGSALLGYHANQNGAATMLRAETATTTNLDQSTFELPPFMRGQPEIGDTLPQAQPGYDEEIRGSPGPPGNDGMAPPLYQPVELGEPVRFGEPEWSPEGPPVEAIPMNEKPKPDPEVLKAFEEGIGESQSMGGGMNNPMEENPSEPEPASPMEENPGQPEPASPMEENPSQPEPASPMEENPSEPEPASPLEENPSQQPASPMEENPSEPEPASPMEESPTQPEPASEGVANPTEEHLTEPENSPPTVSGEPETSKPEEQPSSAAEGAGSAGAGTSATDQGNGGDGDNDDTDQVGSDTGSDTGGNRL